MACRAQNRRPDRSDSFALALQGGGAHGAYTWGVLDLLLEEDRFPVGALSGSSAGAVNAVALASGWARGGAEGARETLARVWEAVAQAAAASPLRLPMMGDISGSAGASVDLAFRLLPPALLNPLDLNPLRAILSEAIDFDAVWAPEAPRLFIAATHVRTGRARIFRNEEIGLDAILASACLPQLNKAVTIGGEEYWDGGFSTNPTVVPLVFEVGARDILIVMIDPLSVADVPSTSQSIRGRVGQILFNAPLMRELETLHGARTAIGARGPFAGSGARALGALNFHLIESGGLLDGYGPASKLNASRGFMDSLYHAGRAEAAAWLRKHAADVGHRDTLHLSDLVPA